MGSTGSGSFSDYSGYSQNNPSNKGNSNGGTSGEDQCTRAFSSALEEVAICDYFTKKNDVPIKGTPVKIEFKGRIAVINNKNELIGYLPTKFNYIRACMLDGYSYEGVVHASSKIPIPSVSVDFAPMS